MNEITAPVIQFLGYRVTNISYHCDPDTELNIGDTKYKFNFSKSNILLSDSEIQEDLCIYIFHGEDSDFSSSRYQLSVGMSGRFQCSGMWQSKWEANALAILFPYLRSLVSIITSNSGREPLILPTVNLASLFDEQA